MKSVKYISGTMKIFILFHTFSTFVSVNMVHVNLYPADWVWCSFRPQPRLGPTGSECHATALQICEYCFQSTIVRYTPVRHARSAPTTTTTRHERRHHIHARPSLTSPTITPLGSVTSTAVGAFCQQIDTRPVEHKNQLPPLLLPPPPPLLLSTKHVKHPCTESFQRWVNGIIFILEGSPCGVKAGICTEPSWCMAYVIGQCLWA